MRRARIVADIRANPADSNGLLAERNLCDEKTIRNLRKATPDLSDVAERKGLDGKVRHLPQQRGESECTRPVDDVWLDDKLSLLLNHVRHLPKGSVIKVLQRTIKEVERKWPK